MLLKIVSVLQDENQSFHWSNSQCSIQPFVIYYEDVSNVLKEKSFDFISEDLKHDTAFIYEVMSKVCEYVKGNYQHIKKIIKLLPPLQWFWFGRRVEFVRNQSWHCSDFDLKEGWNLFTTSHGKSVVDGIRGTIKQLTARASFRRPYNSQILWADAGYQFCSKTKEKILFNLIERDTLNLLWDKIACQYEHGETVPGTCSYLQSCPVSVDEIGYKWVSDDNDLAGTFTFSKAATFVLNNLWSCSAFYREKKILKSLETFQLRELL